INMNYRTGKVNLFANLNNGQWNGFQDLHIQRTFKDASTKVTDAIFEQQTHMRNRNSSYNLKLGADYYISKNTTLGIVTSGFINPERETSSSTSNLMNPQHQVDSIVYATSDNHNKWKNGSINFNFRHQFDSTGRE